MFVEASGAGGSDIGAAVSAGCGGGDEESVLDPTGMAASASDGGCVEPESDGGGVSGWGGGRGVDAEVGEGVGWV